MNLSENLYRLRRNAGLSQEELAGELGVSRQAVSKWETGQAQPDLDKIVQLAAFYKTTVDDLLSNNREMPESAAAPDPAVTPGPVAKCEEAPVFVPPVPEMSVSQFSKEYTEKASDYYLEDGKVLTIDKDEAERIVDLWTRPRLICAVSVMLFILSPVVLLICAGYSYWRPDLLPEGTAVFAGVCVLLLFVAAGVGLQIKAGSIRKPCDIYTRRLIWLEPDLKAEYETKQNEYRKSTSWMVTTAIILFILSPLPVISIVMGGGGRLSEALLGLWSVVGVSILLIFVFCGVGLLLYQEAYTEACDILLQKGDFNKWRKTHPQYETIISIYWICVLAVYLGVSLSLGNWGDSWLIWIVGVIGFLILNYWLKTHLKAASTRLNEED